MGGGVDGVVERTGLDIYRKTQHLQKKNGRRLR